ncbi:MAG TPA: putative lipid II flippase FtsW [Patescibacteria group bacterium]|nr:putative lipid II flippase FtsW [Patescibacteria group bacterium]
MKRFRHRKLEQSLDVYKSKFDKQFLYLILGLVVVGLVFVADISAPQALNFFNDRFYFLKQQFAWAAIGLVAMMIVSKIHYSFWAKISIPFFIVSILLLLVVLIPAVSLEALGARRWIVIGPINFQPSEIIKLSLALCLAKIASTKNLLSESNREPLVYFIPLVLACGLIMLQPDLGTTLVVGIIGITQIFASGVSLLYFLISLVVGLISVAILILVSPYRRDRLMTFFEITKDPLGKGYHIRQILLALGSGGLFGLGIGQSRQKYLFLPEASTDSIFAAISEEIGFIGSFVLILIFAIFIFKAFKIASHAPDQFSKILAVGITAWIGGQILLNIAAMTALTPLTGIPLPFFSYGGTSLSMILVSCGILLNISRYAIKKTTAHR